MLKIVSFHASGEFAAFRDPSVTSNQTVYYLPSKTAIMGMIGAILGIERSHAASENYTKSYIELFGKTRIGIELESIPEKISFFTNHRSLKEAKTKPFKTELLFRPRYWIFVNSDQEINKKIFDSISGGDYVYPPYLGHAYCHAKLTDPDMHEADEYDGYSYSTSCVVLDESETFNKSFGMQAEPESDTSSLIIERHLYHRVRNGTLEAYVLKHWIPTGGSSFKITSDRPTLSKIVKLDNGKVVCLY
jgi:CRISPR-associated protein Cas5h